MDANGRRKPRIRAETEDGELLVTDCATGDVLSDPNQVAAAIFVKHGCIPQSPKRFAPRFTSSPLRRPRQRGAGRPRGQRRCGASSSSAGSDPGDDPEPGKGPAPHHLLSSSTAAASFGAAR